MNNSSGIVSIGRTILFTGHFSRLGIGIWYDVSLVFYTWWRHQMEPFSALLALCAGNLPVTGEFPSQRPVTRSFDVFFDLRLFKRPSKQSWGWWFETPRQRVNYDVIVMNLQQFPTVAWDSRMQGSTVIIRPGSPTYAIVNAQDRARYVVFARSSLHDVRFDIVPLFTKR